MNLFVAITDLS